jgi:hypothetical protein
MAHEELTARQRLELAVLEADYELCLEREEYLDLMRVSAAAIRFLTGLTREQTIAALVIAPLAVQAALGLLVAHADGRLRKGDSEG